MQFLRHRFLTASLTVVLTAFGCGKPAPRPSDADVAAYVAQSQPACPTTVFVTAGTDEAGAYADRARRFLDVLGRAPKP